MRLGHIDAVEAGQLDQTGDEVIAAAAEVNAAAEAGEQFAVVGSDELW